MSTTFLSQEIWPLLTKAVSGSRQSCAVAVAYFGKGASQLLPLSEGSLLVVDASERSVMSGQTCPDDLLKLVKRGVAVYSVPNLHSKVFVLGRTAYIGSGNVSRRSSEQLVEAFIRTTDLKAVQSARRFVEEICLHELTPEVLASLAKIYRPPVVPGQKRVGEQRKMTSKQPTLPRLLLAQLRLVDWSEHEQAVHDAGLPSAKKHRKHPRSFLLESFCWTGNCPYRRGDLVIQVTNEGHGRVLLSPPGNVLHVRTRRTGERTTSFVYLERPDTRRKAIGVAARILQCTEEQLRRNGLVRNLSLAQALLSTWTVTR